MKSSKMAVPELISFITDAYNTDPNEISVISLKFIFKGAVQNLKNLNVREKRMLFLLQNKFNMEKEFELHDMVMLFSYMSKVKP